MMTAERAYVETITWAKSNVSNAISTAITSGKTHVEIYIGNYDERVWDEVQQELVTNGFQVKPSPQGSARRILEW